MMDILIADNSISGREHLRAILESDPDLKVIGLAGDGLEALELTLKLKPHIVVMEINMPRMNGFEATRRIMEEHPTPVVMLAPRSKQTDAETSARALSAGALALLPNPGQEDGADFEFAAIDFRRKVKVLSEVKVVHRRHPSGLSTGSLRLSEVRSDRKVAARIVAIAASTGGPPALTSIFSALQAKLPVPVLVVQHISEGFVNSLAEQLCRACLADVKVASEGEHALPGKIYLAPDRHHMGISRDSTIILSRLDPVKGFRPSATFLFFSIAEAFGSAAAGVILTGMGSDGVEGLRGLRAAGGKVIAQDEESSLVFGMPASAIACGLADLVLPLNMIAPKLLELTSHAK